MTPEEMLVTYEPEDIDILADMLRTALRERDEAREDSRRIDWLNNNGWTGLLKNSNLRFSNDIRIAIDKQSGSS